MARVLVVDDDPLVRNAMTRLCRHMGLEVAAVEHGRDALKWLEDGCADVVLLDLLMPEIDGFGVLEALQRQPRLLRPAVILMTGAVDAHERIRSSELGAIDFVEKPVHGDDLERRMKRAIAVVEMERSLARDEGALTAMRQVDLATGLGTYAQLREVIEKEFHSAEEGHHPLVCMLLADDGHRRCLNESGQRGSDVRLQSVVHALHCDIDSELLFRVDAAEFVLLIPRMSLPDAVRAAYAVHQQLDGQSGFVAGDIAIGLAAYPRPDITHASLLFRAANVALAHARLPQANGTAVYE